jgi:hypothetical protein
LVAIVELRAAREARINLTVTVTLIGSAARRLSNYLALLWQIFQFEEPIRIPESIFQ